MIADGMVNMDQKMPTDIDHEPTAAAKDEATHAKEEEKDADTLEGDDQPKDTDDVDALEETEQKEVDAVVNDKPNTEPDTPVDVITESVKEMDLHNDEAKQTEPEESSQIDAMENEYQPQETMVEEAQPEPEIEEALEIIPQPEPEPDTVDEAESEPEIDQSANTAQQTNAEVTEEPTVQQCEEPMVDAEKVRETETEPEVADVTDAVDVDNTTDTVDEPQPAQEADELNEDADVEVEEDQPEQDAPMEASVVDTEPVQVTQTAVLHNALQQLDDTDEVEVEAIEQDTDVPTAVDMDFAEKDVVSNAEPNQTAPVVDDEAEPGIADDEFIIKTVLSFVEINPDEIDMRFDTETHGGNLQFADGRTVSKVNDDAPSICVYGQPISADTHQTCDIEVQWNASASEEEGGFYMGYLTKRKEDIRYWNAELGSILCLDSVGYYVYGGCGYFREMREGNCHEIGYRAPSNLKAGDTMRMIVDFAKDTLTLRHNGKMAAICPLYGHKEITLAFSFGPQGEEIEVLSCELK